MKYWNSIMNRQDKEKSAQRDSVVDKDVEMQNDNQGDGDDVDMEDSNQIVDARGQKDQEMVEEHDENHKRIRDKMKRVQAKFDMMKLSMKNQDFQKMNFGTQKYLFKQQARSLPMIGPLHFMILRLEQAEDFEERINLIRNIESMIRLPRPMIQLFLTKMDAHILVSKILLGESISQTGRTEQLRFLSEELEIACFDFLGELVKSNKRCLAMFEIQLGEHNVLRIIRKGLNNVVNSNLFFRSQMISMIYFYDKTNDLEFIENSILCQQVLNNTTKIVTSLLDEVKDKEINSNNKSTVITCLMTIYLLKHLQKFDKLEQLLQALKAPDGHYRETLVSVLNTGILYFQQKPSDSVDLNPILYVKYNPTLIKTANDLLEYL